MVSLTHHISHWVQNSQRLQGAAVIFEKYLKCSCAGFPGPHMHDEFHGHVNTVTYESNLSESEPVGSYLKCQNRQFSFTVVGEPVALHLFPA